MQVEVVREALTALRSAYDELAASGIDTLTCEELLATADDLEILDRQLPTQRHRILTQLHAQATPHYHRPEELHPPPSDAWMPPREADDPATNTDNTTHQSRDPGPPDGKAA